MSLKIYKVGMGFLCAGAMAMAMCGCGSSAASSTAQSVETTTTPAASTSSVVSTSTTSTSMVNPWTTCTSLAEATTIAGFDFTFPESIYDNTYKATTYQAMPATSGTAMIDVKYSNGVSELEIRQAKLTTEDISGDYNEYDQVNTEKFNDLTYTTKGTNGLIYVTTCNYQGMSYVLYTPDGFTKDQVEYIFDGNLVISTGTESNGAVLQAEAVDGSDSSSSNTDSSSDSSNSSNSSSDSSDGSSDSSSDYYDYDYDDDYDYDYDYYYDSDDYYDSNY